MRFIVMHKVDDVMERGEPPDARIVKEMGELVQEGLHGGWFLDGAGLKPSSERLRISLRGGERTITRGPLTGANELLASFVQIKVRTLEEAVERATRLGKAVGRDVDVQLGPVVEPWDLGLFPKPSDDLPTRYLLFVMGDASTEAGERHAPRIAPVIDEMSRAGVLLASEELAPSKTGARSRVSGGKRSWTDGPFTESKELIAGFSLLELGSRHEALAWATRYGAILGENEVDVREVY